MLAFLFTLHLLLASAVYGRGLRVHDSSFTPDYVLVATAENYAINCQSRYSVLVNGTAPGPELRLVEGKNTWVRVWNNIPDQNFTIHWHGIAQRLSPFSDGTPMVASWPIAPGQFFDYEITPQIGDAGTYFYHSHVGFQAVTANGALIVEDAGTPPYQYDSDKVLLLGDFFPANDTSIEQGLLANPFKWSGETDAVTINGFSGNASFSNASDPSCRPYTIHMRPGETSRLRFIGRTAISLVTLGIEDHDVLPIIEADGAYTKSYTTDHMQVATGQRFSVLFQGKTQDELNALGKTQFWVRYETRLRPANTTGYALLQYDVPGGCGPQAPPADLPSVSPVTLPQNVSNWLEYSLSPLTIQPNDTFPTLSEVTRTVVITEAQFLPIGMYDTANKSIDGVLEWGSNGLPWQLNRQESDNFTPYLIDIYTGSRSVPNYTAAISSGTGYDNETRAFPAMVGEVLDIVWQSNSGPTGGFDFHPFHAHGAHYWDLGSGSGIYNATQNEAYFANYTPAKRDTTILYRYETSGSANETDGWRAWRIRITEDDVGAWMIHCHILQHMIMGMQTVWVYGTEEQVTSRFPAQPYVNGYLTYGGSAFGNASFDPLVYEYGS